MSDPIEKAVEKVLTPAWRLLVTPRPDGTTNVHVEGVDMDDVPLILQKCAFDIGCALLAARREKSPIIQVSGFPTGLPRRNGERKETL